MNTTEKKHAWRLLGEAIDHAGADGVPAELFLTRAALLFALDSPSLDQVRQTLELALEAGRAAATETADIRAELAATW